VNFVACWWRCVSRHWGGARRASSPSARVSPSRRIRAPARDFRSRDAIDHAARKSNGPPTPESVPRRGYGRGSERHQTASCFSGCISYDDEMRPHHQHCHRCGFIAHSDAAALIVLRNFYNNSLRADYRVYLTTLVVILTANLQLHKWFNVLTLRMSYYVPWKDIIIIELWNLRTGCSELLLNSRNVHHHVFISNRIEISVSDCC